MQVGPDNAVFGFAEVQFGEVGEFLHQCIIHFHAAKIAGIAEYLPVFTGCFRTHFFIFAAPLHSVVGEIFGMEMQKKIVMSGIRPTGYLHLGNYFGAVRNYVRLQNEFECYFMVADLHSLTTHPDTRELKQHVHRVLAENIACGLDPDKAALYCQSHIYETAELYLYLNMLAYKGELEKTVTFKEKARQHPDNVNAGLLTYPVLQTADILLHRASYVPVGKDQEQHLEMARNFANRFNHRYGQVFIEPEAFNFGEQLVKVPSLDGTGKMSKSQNENATLYLADSDEQIRSKIKKAKMDGGPKEPNSQKSEEVENIFALMRLVSQPETVAFFESAYNDCSIRYGDFKQQLGEDMVKFIAPIREKAEAIRNDHRYLREIMEKGAEKARKSARATIETVREVMGLNYF